MTHLARVWHFLKKDIAHARWLISLFLGSVVAATVQSLRLSPGVVGDVWPATYSRMDNTIRDLLLMIGAYLGAAFTATTITHDDSPTNVNSFWKSQPANAKYLSLSKWVLVMLISVLVVTIAQAGTLYATGLPFDIRSGAIWYAVYYFASFLAVALVVAAITPNVQIMVIGCLGLVLFRAMVIDQMLAPRLRDRLPGILRGNLDIRLFFVIAAALWFWLYLADGASVRIKRVVGVVLLALLAAGWHDPDSQEMMSAKSAASLPKEVLPEVRMVAARRATTGLEVDLAAQPAMAGTRYVLAQPMFAVSVAGEEPTVVQGRIVSRTPGIIERAEMDLNDWSPILGNTGEASLRTENVVAVRDAFEEKGAAVRLEALLVKQEAHTIFDHPLAMRQYSVEDDRRITIAQITRDTNPVSVRIDALQTRPITSWFVDVTADSLSPITQLHIKQHTKPGRYGLGAGPLRAFAIYHGGRDTAQLRMQLGFDERQTLAFPTTRFARQTMFLVRTDSDDSSWIQDARLVIQEWKYVSHAPVQINFHITTLPVNGDDR